MYVMFYVLCFVVCCVFVSCVVCCIYWWYPISGRKNNYMVCFLLCIFGGVWVDCGVVFSDVLVVVVACLSLVERNVFIFLKK